ncbi:MAG: hypothetical protein NTY35_02245 [Planctomycetota bacterium]|nr:hypothetical protein [Planctomycetota bacterium]
MSTRIDTVIVIDLAFCVLPALLGQGHRSAGQAAVVSLTNHVHKFVLAVVMTPVLCLVHGAVRRGLGAHEAEHFARIAHATDPLK